MTADVEIRSIAAEQAHPLRRLILRELAYPGDDHARSLHVGAFLSGEPIGVGSVHLEAFPDTNDLRSWRLRGVAVVPEHRRGGAGTLMLVLLTAHAIDQSGTWLWCIAPADTREFFMSAGFTVFDDTFETTDMGPRLGMRRWLAASADFA